MKHDNGARTAKNDWYVSSNGVSPAKSLGLDADERRVAMAYCTTVALLNGRKCHGCGPCRLPPFHQRVKASKHTPWPELPIAEREALKDLYFSPDFSLPGFSNLPQGQERLEKCSLAPVKLPSKELRGLEYTRACEELAAELERRAKNGWLPFSICCTAKRAAPAACKALLKNGTVDREIDYTFTGTVDQAKAEAKAHGKATITIGKRPAKEVRFDDWAIQIQEFKKSGREFPLLGAIRESLAGVPCLVRALSIAAVCGID